MAKRLSVLAESRKIVRQAIEAGFKVGKPIVVKIETGTCKVEGCGGTVGKLWPIGLVNKTAPDGVTKEVLLGYPCDRCGALHGTPTAEEIIEDRQRNRVFYQGKQLVHRDRHGRVVLRDRSRIRG